MHNSSYVCFVCLADIFSDYADIEIKDFMMIPTSYIDPSSGSLVLQLIAGAFLGSILTIKLWWNRATDKIKKMFVRKSEDS